MVCNVAEKGMLLNILRINDRRQLLQRNPLECADWTTSHFQRRFDLIGANTVSLPSLPSPNTFYRQDMTLEIVSVNQKYMFRPSGVKNYPEYYRIRVWPRGLKYTNYCALIGQELNLNVSTGIGSEKRTKQPEIDENATPRTLCNRARKFHIQFFPESFGDHNCSAK